MDPTSGTSPSTPTVQSWFSWTAWSAFFSELFSSISQMFWGDASSLSEHNVKLFPETVNPQSVQNYMKETFSSKISLAEEAINLQQLEEGQKIISLLKKIKEEVETAISGDSSINHDYTSTKEELARVQGLSSRLSALRPDTSTPLSLDIHPSFGLKNGGNNCFINTIIQIVFPIPELVKHIVFGQGQHLIVQETYQKYKTLQGAKDPVDPPNLSAPLRNIHQQFKGEGQHDAFEFLLKTLIDPLKKEGNPLFFGVEERLYYHNYEEHKDQITEPFEPDGGRIPPTGKETWSSLQLILSSESPCSTMEQLIEKTLKEEYLEERNALYVNFQTNEGEKVWLPLAKKCVKVAPPPFLFVDFKRFSFENGKPTKNKTPVTFDPLFFIPPELTIDGKGAKYEWVALVSGGEIQAGHYVAKVKVADGRYYEYNDALKKELVKEAFIDAGKECYGGFARRVECENAKQAMSEHCQSIAIHQEIGRAVYEKGGEEKELELLALFNQHLSQENPFLYSLQKIYDHLPPSFHAFVELFLLKNPRDCLIQLKSFEKPSLCAIDDMAPTTPIATQYEHIRRKHYDFVRENLTQTEREERRLEREKANLTYLLTVEDDHQKVVAAILDPGLEKLLERKGVGQLLEENRQELEVLRFKEENAAIRTQR